METITLFYLALGFAFMLLIIVAVLFKRFNSLKEYYKDVRKKDEQELIQAEKRLSQYEKTNVEQIKKINELDAEIDKYLTQLTEYKESECRALNNNERLKEENTRLYLSLQDKVDFLNSLNERLQKAEADTEKYFNKFHEQREDNRLLADERDELLSKLSRKGTGTKGSKKKEVVFNNESDDAGITEVEFEEYIDLSEVKTLTDYIGYEFIATDENGNKTKGIICEDKTGSECIVAFEKIDGVRGWKIRPYNKTIPEKYHSSGFCALYMNHDSCYFTIFKIIKK